VEVVTELEASEVGGGREPEMRLLCLGYYYWLVCINVGGCCPRLMLGDVDREVAVGESMGERREETEWSAAVEGGSCGG